MTTLSVLIFSLLVALLAINIWQTNSFKKHAKASFRSSQLNDQKYYELKYQLQFVTSVFPIILSILLYAGYTQLDSLPKKIQEEIASQVKPQIDNLKKSTEALKEEQKNIEDKYSFLVTFYQTLQGKGTSINKSLGNSNAALVLLEQKLNNLQNQTDVISNKDIVNQPIYVVTNLNFKMDEDKDVQYYKFSDCKTISGNKLPEFTKPPLILAFSNYGAQINICGVTNKQFNATHWMSSDGPSCKSVINNQIEFGLIIFEQK
jgi:hypothetical protein